MTRPGRAGVEPRTSRSRSARLNTRSRRRVLLVGCLTSQQHASVSQGRMCSDDFTCCHTEIVAADQIFYLTQSQFTDTRRTSPSADPIRPGAWQGSHCRANFEVTDMTQPKVSVWMPSNTLIVNTPLCLSWRVTASDRNTFGMYHTWKSECGCL